MTPLQKFPKNMGNLGTIFVVKALKNCPKCNKSLNLVTLLVSLIKAIVVGGGWWQSQSSVPFSTLRLSRSKSNCLCKRKWKRERERKCSLVKCVLRRGVRERERERIPFISPTFLLFRQKIRQKKILNVLFVFNQGFRTHLYYRAVTSSVTRSGDLLGFGHLFKAFGNN